MSENKIFAGPILITRGEIIFPSTTTNIDVGRIFSISALNKAQDLFDSKIVIVSQKEIGINEPTDNDILSVGTMCKIDAVQEINGIFRIRVTGVERVIIKNVHKSSYLTKPSYDCEYELFPMIKEEITSQTEKLVKDIMATLSNPETAVSSLPRPIIYRLEKGVSVEDFTNILSKYLDMPFEKRFDLISDSSIASRVNKLSLLLTNGKVSEEVERDINRQINEKNKQAQREYVLREKLKVIQDELDDMGDSEDSVEKYLKMLEENPYPESVKKKVRSEINRFKQLPTSSVESSMAKGYIDTIMSIPWFEESVDNNDILRAEQILDEDHYGLEKVKERILEYLAVKNVTKSLKAPILCLYGPPGTGKTSLAKSVARALDRKFVKASLGGTSDESEIRGHRRTYVASMPGKIIKGMKTAGVINPVFLLDEIDKLTANNHGDPASALLEVLDPEQNSVFQDNYLEETYDLSKVLFIATANYLENIPPALKDRLELIELNTYTNEEKYNIAIKHLIPKQCEQNGIDPKKIAFDDKAIYYIMDYYTREAGVRNLERKIGTIVRKALVAQLKANNNRKQTITVSKVKEYLGTEVFEYSKKDKDNQVGIVNGLAYTQYGGEILPIEVTYYKGKGGLTLTGNLGNVMKESATIALSYVKTNAEKYGIDPNKFAEVDVHIHVPEGAVPKDGPSAGIALTVALVSAFSNKKVNANVAMTGEVNLRGNALAIGGLKEKTLAAYRSGIKKVLIPRQNERNLSDVAKIVKENVEFVLLDNVEQALKETLVD